MVLVGCVVALAACGGGASTDPAAQAVSTSPPAQSDLVAGVYQQMSGGQRVRQLIMPSIDDLDPASARTVVRQTRPGGLIIMAPGTAKQWRAVAKAAQDEARQLGLPPLLIGADQENGTLVRRLNMPVTLPGAMVLGAAVAGDSRRGTEASAAMGDLTGQWLAAAGVNIDFAPVADVNVRPSNPVIGIRSPGAFPGIVGRAVAGQVEGFDQAGVLSTAKHFPGHGDTATDSHLGLAKVTHSRKQMARIDLPPFQDAVDAGVPAIMVAHVTVPAYDNRPATVSKKIVTGILRKRMGFDGLVVSDSLGMGAVASRPELAVEVIKAGGDVLLMPNEPTRAVAQVLQAQGNGLSPARVRDAVLHVLEAKQRLGLLEAAPTYPTKPIDEDHPQDRPGDRRGGDHRAGHLPVVGRQRRDGGGLRCCSRRCEAGPSGRRCRTGPDPGRGVLGLAGGCRRVGCHRFALRRAEFRGTAAGSDLRRCGRVRLGRGSSDRWRARRTRRAARQGT